MICDLCKRHDDDESACAIACRNGHLECLISAVQKGYPLSECECYHAAEKGHLHCLMWFIKNRYKYNISTVYGPTVPLPCLIYLIKNGYPGIVWNDNGGNDTFLHLETLIYATNKEISQISLDACADTNGFPGIMWMIKTPTVVGAPKDTSLSYNKKPLPNENEGLCAIASSLGNLSCLIYARKHGYQWHEDTCANATENEHFHCLIYARSAHCPWDEDISVLATLKNNLLCLMWARKHQCKMDRNVINDAIKIGNSLNCVAYLRKSKCKITSKCFAIRFEMDFTSLYYAKKYTRSWHSNTCSIAATYGSLLYLMWARKNKCPWHGSTSPNTVCSTAAYCGFLPCLRWARKSGASLDYDTINDAVIKGHLHCLIWARHTTPPFPWNKDTCTNAKENKGLIRKWIHIQPDCPCNCLKDIYMSIPLSEQKTTNICNICLEPLDDTTVKFISCRHYYHKTCMDTMLATMERRHCSICDRGT